MHKRHGFTLGETLIVFAIIALLAALLFPVFRTAKAAAKASVCLHNFHQGSLAVSLYAGDYDDRFMPANYRPGLAPDPSLDRTWVQLILPYAREFRVFRCPSDFTVPESTTAFDPDLGAGDTYGRYYTASLHTNLGYNASYLAPSLRVGGAWIPDTRTLSQAENPGFSLVMVDSVWEVRDGFPHGGGSFVVTPPCRFELRGRDRVDSFQYGDSSGEVYAPEYGWKGDRKNFDDFGHVWPWHEGRATALRMDGGVRSLTITHLTEGCDAQPFWRGEIHDSGAYMWDLR